MVTKSTEASRVKYTVAVLAAVAAVALPHGLTAVANAQKVWDIEGYDFCMEVARASYQRGETTLQDLTLDAKTCCESNDGVWNAGTQDCQAPPGDTAGTRQIPGTIRIPTDMAIAPVVTKPPQQTQVSDQPFTVR